jgi:hypothetical protein
VEQIEEVGDDVARLSVVLWTESVREVIELRLLRAIFLLNVEDTCRSIVLNEKHLGELGSKTASAM